jgi:hypothetical protein
MEVEGLSINSAKTYRRALNDNKFKSRDFCAAPDYKFVRLQICLVLEHQEVIQAAFSQKTHQNCKPLATYWQRIAQLMFHLC